MEKFEPVMLNGALTPIEVIEFRWLLAWYMKTHINELIELDREWKWHHTDSESDAPAFYLWLASVLLEAEIVLWDKPMYDFAISGQELFAGFTVSDDVLSRPVEFWLRNYDIRNEIRNIPEDEDIEGRFCLPYDTQAELLVPDQEHSSLGIFTFNLRPSNQSKAPLVDLVWDVEPGYTYPSMLNECPAHLLTMPRMEFLKSSIVRSEKEHIPRHVRRQAKRENIHEPIVRVIRLRRIQKRGSSGSDGASGGIDYSCQWLVRHHWRNQYHPSTNDHKPAFIDAYIKGPEDKPFKPPKDYVFKVDR